MKKPLLFVSSTLLSLGLLVGCNVNGDNDNESPTGVRYDNRGFDTENVRYDYNYDDRIDPGDVRFDRNVRNDIFDNDFGIDRADRRNGGDADLIDVDYDNAEPDPGEEPNEDRNPAVRGTNENGNGMRNGTR